MRLSRRKLAAWFALAAMLFSALSPAMASVLFSGRPDVLARVLGVPTKPMAGAHADICHQEADGVAQHGNAEYPISGDGTGHAAHGIFCSFCLAASSMVTVPGITHVSAAPIVTVAAFVPAGRVHLPAERLPSTHRSRAPPAFS